MIFYYTTKEAGTFKKQDTALIGIDYNLPLEMLEKLADRFEWHSIYVPSIGKRWDSTNRMWLFPIIRLDLK